MTLSVTKADILSFNPCECDSIARIDDLFDGRETLTANDVLDLPMPPDHKLWLVLRPDLIADVWLAMIRQQFIVTLTPELSEGIENLDTNALISRVLKSHRYQQSDEETYSQMIKIVRDYLDI